MRFGAGWWQPHRSRPYPLRWDSLTGCWLTGGLGSAILIYLALHARLPMQAALQVYYVVISAYGWWHWTREEAAQGTLMVTTWPIRRHLVACAAVLVISVLTA